MSEKGWHSHTWHWYCAQNASA